MTPADQLASWTARPLPPREAIVGDRVRLEPVDPDRHASQLFSAVSAGGDPGLWDYLAYGPFADLGEFHVWLTRQAESTDPLFFAIVDEESGEALGMGSFMRMDPANGVIEIGHIWFSPGLQRSTLATEAIYLMQRVALGELGYRRLEWKCNDANERSKRAADRFGFTFEGVFRQHAVAKGKNRDTAWFSLLDHEWEAYDRAVRRWLSPDNFDSEGQQIRSLRELRGR